MLVVFNLLQAVVMDFDNAMFIGPIQNVLRDDYAAWLLKLYHMYRRKI